MKKGILTFSLCLIGICWGQRNMNFSTVILSPVDNEQLSSNQAANFSIQVTNQGTEDFLATDSLYVYLFINGSQVFFQPSGSDHTDRTGNAISSGGTFNFALPLGFTSAFENTTDDFCIKVVPVNSTNVILDPVMSDNTDCVTVTFVANAGLEELEANTGLIYPNPASESFVVSGNLRKVIVTDINGSGIPIEMSPDGTINCSSWPNGCYFIHSADSQTSFTKRIIVSH